jgi:hypothetical protein
MKKLSTACQIIRNVKTFLSALALKIIYRAFFHLAMSLTTQYLFSLLIFVVQDSNLFSTNIEIHNIDTRQRNNLYIPQANLTRYQKGAYYSGIKIFNSLPMETKNAADNL